MFTSWNWRHLNKPHIGVMNEFSSTIAGLELREPYALPSIHGQLFLILSDYSGDHDLAEYQSLSFLFADLQRCQKWEGMRLKLRQNYLSDGRRISFKGLRDKKQQIALPSLLTAADTIPGLSVTILIHKSIESLFTDSGYIDLNNPEFHDYRHWKIRSFEKMLRVVHFVSFFLSGLSRPGQDVLWITDQDEIAANDNRLRELTKLFGTL